MCEVIKNEITDTGSGISIVNKDFFKAIINTAELKEKS